MATDWHEKDTDLLVLRGEVVAAALGLAASQAWSDVHAEQPPGEVEMKHDHLDDVLQRYADRHARLRLGLT